MNVPEGFKLVPLRPTEAMNEAYNNVPSGFGGSPAHSSHVWEAMISAAPAPAVVQAETGKFKTSLALLNELSLLWHNDHKIATLNSRQYPTTTMEFDEVMEKIEEFTLPERLK